MGKYLVKIEEFAQKEINAHYKAGNKATIKRIHQILHELATTPFEGIGNPEALKYELSGFWSRRINQKDRLFYYVEEYLVTVYVISAMGHYEK